MISKKLIPVILFGLVLFFGVYKLSESPPTWYDEGMIIQPAINRAQRGEMAVQIAPGELVSPQFISTGYPVIYPIAIVFKYFGVSLLHARSVMVFYLLLAAAVFFFLAKSLFGLKNASYAAFLLAGFAPFYGNGKNVLGEVPGLFWLMLFLFYLNRLERGYGQVPRIYYALAGVSFGLCLVTKPLFLLLAPAVLVAVLLLRKRVAWGWRPVLLVLASFLVPVYFWLATQFGFNDSLAHTFTFYSNPYGAPDLFPVIWRNIVRLFTEISPAYFFALFVIWASAVVIRIKKKERISLAEITAFAFSGLVLLAYLRTVGWYRYFFTAQVITLLFMPTAIFVLLNFAQEHWRWLPRFVRYSFMPVLIICLLSLFHFYQLGFKSWVAKYYDSHTTSVLTEYFGGFKKEQSVFIYDSPEIVTFLPHNNYYQYIEIANSFKIGVEQIANIDAARVDLVVLKTKFLEENKERFTKYAIRDTIAQYTVLKRTEK